MIPSIFYIEYNPNDDTTRYAYSCEAPWIKDIVSGKIQYTDEEYILIKCIPVLPIEL